MFRLSRFLIILLLANISLLHVGSASRAAGLSCHELFANLDKFPGFADYHDLSPEQREIVFRDKPKKKFKKILDFPPLPAESNDVAKQQYEDFIRENYEYGPNEKIDWVKTRKGLLPVIVKGRIRDSLQKPQVDLEKAIPDPRTPVIDVAVIGGGLAGLNSAHYVARESKNAGTPLTTMVIDSGEKVGGIANWSDRGGITYGEGGAYFTPPEGYWYKIAKDLGVMAKLKVYQIHEWIDSFRHNDKTIPGLWENKQALQAMLEADYSAFLYCMKKINEAGDIYIQPLERGKNIKKYDNMSMRDWMLTIPEQLKSMARDGDKTAAEILERLSARKEPLDVDSLWGRVTTRLEDRMKIRNVNKLLELYGRSAAGDHPDVVNAALFLNFYISEIGVRFTGPEGSGAITKQLLKVLRDYTDQVNYRTSSTVAKVVPQKDGTSLVYYVRDGVVYKVLAKRVIFSSQLKFAPALIEGFNKESAPEKINAIEKLEYRHYLVINLHTQGHALEPGTYDLWTRRDKNYDQRKITDIIDGRWIEFDGAPEGKRDDNRGVATVYVPLPAKWSFEHMSQKQILAITKSAIDQATRFVNDSNGARDFKIVAAQTNVWANSIHIASVGHFGRMRAFNTPFKGIYFAHSNQGTPSVEEALVRGLFAAYKALRYLGIYLEPIKLETPPPLDLHHDAEASGHH